VVFATMVGCFAIVRILAGGDIALQSRPGGGTEGVDVGETTTDEFKTLGTLWEAFGV